MYRSHDERRGDVLQSRVGGFRGGFAEKSGTVVFGRV